MKFNIVICHILHCNSFLKRKYNFKIREFIGDLIVDAKVENIYIYFFFGCFLSILKFSYGCVLSAYLLGYFITTYLTFLKKLTM